MKTDRANGVPVAQLRTLAEFRYRLRTFVQFSEQAAHNAGLQPQQHQLLLQIAGAPATAVPTIAYAAERLGLRHNSVVELANRCVEEGLLERTADESDARRFQEWVMAEGFKATVRQNLGRDIEGACGQLVVLEKAA